MALQSTRVYELIDNSWIQLGRDIDGESRRDGSGSSVDISKDGNRVAVGAILNDGVNGGTRAMSESLNIVVGQLGADIGGQQVIILVIHEFLIMVTN